MSTMKTKLSDRLCNTCDKTCKGFTVPPSYYNITYDPVKHTMIDCWRPIGVLKVWDNKVEAEAVG